MSYDTLRKSAFSHQLTAAGAALAVLLMVAGAAVVTANPIVAQNLYRLDYSMNRNDAGAIDIRTRVIDTTNNEVVGEPNITAKPGEQTLMQFARNDDDWKIYVRTNADGSGTFNLVVHLGGREVQNTEMHFPAPGATAARKYNGAPISLNLSQADLRDVINTFGKITGLEMAIAPDVAGTVNVNIKDMPWDQALEQILRENNLTWRLDGNRMEIYKQGGSRP